MDRITGMNTGREMNYHFITPREMENPETGECTGRSQKQKKRVEGRELTREAAVPSS